MEREKERAFSPFFKPLSLPSHASSSGEGKKRAPACDGSKASEGARLCVLLASGRRDQLPSFSSGGKKSRQAGASLQGKCAVDIPTQSESYNIPEDGCVRACVGVRRESERELKPLVRNIYLAQPTKERSTHKQEAMCVLKEERSLCFFSLAERKKKRNKWGLSEKGTDTTTERKKEGALSHAVVVLEAFFRFAVSLTH